MSLDEPPKPESEDLESQQLKSRQLEPRLSTRRLPFEAPDPDAQPSRLAARLRSPRTIKAAASTFVILIVLGIAGLFFAQHWIRTATRDALPQLDGSLRIPGLTAPVTVQRDAQGVPHIHASSLNDLLVAQGFVTASDRLFQMDLLRRHAAGELAEVLGSSAVAHDRLQRTLQVRAAADRALTRLPPEQLHILERYAAGVNALIANQAGHLPIEFRILRYQPAPWTPRDSLLVTLAIFQDLTNAFPAKLARESLVARLPAQNRAALEDDLYPVGSWRDHPPSAATPDLTIEGPPIPDVPLDESQSSLRPAEMLPHSSSAALIAALLADASSLNAGPCLSCTPGSNNWVVSGAHTASGRPLLSDDMHLAHSLPGVWYEADLQAPTSAEPFHAAGVSLPGVPLIVVGHNAHIAWGFTNLGADVQDVYIESTRGAGASAEFQATDGSWQPIVHLPEPIKVHAGRDVAFEVLATRHGDTLTPILNPTLTPEVIAPHGQARTLSLRWTIYDPAAVSIPTLAVDSARDWPTFLAAFRDWGGPAQNLVYADDQGHIGYHAAGKIPLRGTSSPAAIRPLLQPDETPPSQQSPTIRATPDPLDQTQIKAFTPQTPAPAGQLNSTPIAPGPASEWTGYIPFDDLPQIFDPPGGVIATANARITPDAYAYRITLNWAAPYRNERIWKLLAHSRNLTPADMLHIQTDIVSDFDRVLAERLTYALDHTTKVRNAADAKTLHQTADLLRTFHGAMTVDSPAASIVAAVHTALWPLLLGSKLHSSAGLSVAPEVNTLYSWGERDYALEQLLMHTPPRWLPPAFSDWNDFLAAAVLESLKLAKAPADLVTWRYGTLHTVDIEHPLFEESRPLRFLIGTPTGTGAHPQSGDGTTIKQVGRGFGPSERFTADLADFDNSTLNLVEGQSANPFSPWFLDQFSAWYNGTTFRMPFSDAVFASKHTLTLEPG